MNKLLTLITLLIAASSVYAQRTERDYIRSGNHHFRDSLYQRAEVDYRKALDVNPKSAEAMFNLGTALIMQEKAEEAVAEWERATRIVTDKEKLAKLYHNIGVVMHASEQYGPAIEAYKQALRNNPHDNETRYNLALAQRMAKEQEQQQQDQQQDQQDKKDQQEQQEQQQQQQQEQQEQQNQQQPPPEEKEQMSKENAQQMLNAALQDEKETQEKRAQQIRVAGRKIEKDW